MIEAPEPKLPPIMVRYTDNLKNQIAEISNQFEDDVRIKLAGEQLKIFPANSDIHRDITKYLTDGKIEFYVITPKNQRPLKAVLKGLPVSYFADEIATGLAELGLKIDQVRQLTNLKTKAPIPVWQIVYRKASENNKIFEMVDRESLHKYLSTLAAEHDSKVSRTAIETLLTIHRNILLHEENVKYRTINRDNPKFIEVVWSVLPARQFMKKSGWISVDNQIFFNSDERLVDIIEVILEHRNVQPEEREWVESSKVVVKNEDKVREEGLRKKAAIQREKELAEFMKDKEYREDMARKAKQEIQSDRKRRDQLYGPGNMNNFLLYFVFH
ncbi:PUB domain-containing protein [Caerostris extrusa]|uniref:PUB domain-containing protein n=1 Tax=Caerostris extrusa TaxID=172846 RepID=A0AAV4WNN2_CAEEX|nr:PUB domain-containing protein [Caerostris extrusa]